MRLAKRIWEYFKPVEGEMVNGIFPSFKNQNKYMQWTYLFSGSTLGDIKWVNQLFRVSNHTQYNKVAGWNHRARMCLTNSPKIEILFSWPSIIFNSYFLTKTFLIDRFHWQSNFFKQIKIEFKITECFLFTRSLLESVRFAVIRSNLKFIHQRH